MADPITLGMAGVGIGMSVLGGMTGAKAAKQEAAANAQMYNYQAGVARVNEQIAKQDEEYARQRGDVEAVRKGMEHRFEISQAKATQSGRGFDVNTGSNVDVRKSMTDIGTYDQAMVRHNAALQAYGQQVEQTKHAAQAGIYGMSASQSLKAGQYKATSSILGAATSVADKWMAGKSAGIWG